MNAMQAYALANPLARANPENIGAFQRILSPWSLILTVNK